MTHFRKHWPVFVLVGLALIVFHQAFQSELVFWDDDVFILRNDILKMPLFQALSVMFTSYYHGDYLPFTILSYWLDSNIFGQEPFVFHAVNLILHCINIVLVYWLIFKFSQDRLTAFLVAIIFAIHPLQAEPVMWVSERKSLISGGFTLLSLIGYIMFHERQKKRYFVFAILMYLGSILSKTTAILLPVVFLLIDLYYDRFSWKKSALRLLPTFFVIAVFGYIRIISYDYSTPGVSESMFSVERLTYIPLFMTNAIWFYFQKFFWPSALSAIYPFYENSTLNYIKCAAGLSSVFLIAFLIYKKNLKKARLFFLIYILFLLPILHLIPRANLVNDRYMYLPIIGLSFVILELLRAYFSDKLNTKLVLVVTVFILSTLSFRSYSQSKLWHDNLALWQDTVEKNQDNILARNALGLEYHQRKRYAEAIEQFNHVLRLEAPTSMKIKSINNLANIYSDRTYSGFNLDAAIELYELGIASAERPNMIYELRVNYAQTLYQKGDKAKFREILLGVYQEVLRDPDSRNHWLREYIPNVLKQWK